MSGLVKLNTNENPCGPSPRALVAIAEAANDTLRLYPDPTALRLREVIAEAQAGGSQQQLTGVAVVPDKPPNTRAVIKTATSTWT